MSEKTELRKKDVQLLAAEVSDVEQTLSAMAHQVQGFPGQLNKNLEELKKEVEKLRKRVESLDERVDDGTITRPRD